MANFSDISNAVKQFSPGIADAILGPAGGIFISLLENAFHVAAPDLAPTIISHPDSSANTLRELELKHQDAIASLEHANYETAVDDRKSARAMNVAKQDWIMHVLAIIYLILFICYVSLDFLSPAYFDKGIFHDLLN